MSWANIVLPIIIIALVSLYFLPYKKLKGKIFKKLLPDPYAAHEISYVTRESDVYLKREDEVWMIGKSLEWKADARKMRRLLSKLMEIDVSDRITTTDYNNDEYDIGRNGVITIVYSKRTIELKLGGRSKKDDESLYLTKTGDKDVLLVPSAILQFLPKDVESFKDMLLFKAFYSQVTSVEAQFDGKGYLMTKTDAGWMLRGNNVFEEKAHPFIESLLDLGACGFASSSLKLPPKAVGIITLKVSGKAVIRHFFEVEDETDVYLVPLDGEILKVEKTLINNVFGF